MAFGCKEKNQKETLTIAKNEIIDDYFLTERIQSKLTPELVLEILKKRNQEFVNDQLTIRNTSERIRKASLGQYPAAVVLSCLDSRIPVEDVFHSGIGDLFIARVAGNISNEDILGSVEFACKVSGAKVVIVLGHEHCGAIKSAIDKVELGNITGLLNKIKPAIEKSSNFKGDKTSKNAEYVEAVTKENVKQTIENLRNGSSILKNMEDKGEIKIVGGEYHMQTGNVEFISQ
ncbi:carbonic anhydrase [Elizabethkingia meningoseptica]|nr:carbonic anhydrase [Elizabethkingia meningoseptica]AQX47183.1 carbonic anhydrase [Elizabethkingia meningoseptica]KUY17842.1 carbonic anhydrase [Elizabethkingia meningoseptica]MDE5489246.1 carbonic anhydrase [Elizabethkingia meningoseptica]OPB68468.1 carbonic anhydrase [Elizabethkingia meningoseptica]